MQKHILALSLAMGLLLTLPGCANAEGGGTPTDTPTVSVTPSPSAPTATDITQLVLSDSGITVDGVAVSADSTGHVYIGAPIVYYETGHDATYGEGTEAESHTTDEAAAHTVVTITEAGTYRVTGTLSAGQLAIDLGEDAPTDPGAVVTLILDNTEVTCTVAPALIFYNVYECGSSDAATASSTVDTAAAGANIVIADGSENTFTGSHVAKIYKEGTDKKLHKYDAAFYSKMSMNLYGEAAGTGKLSIVADNEGLDAELHLTINGGNIDIQADNDGINTNEDGVSVTTVNGGYLTISAGLGDEGDGIDSNGYLTINGGAVVTYANARAGEGGIDADMGICLNGGTVLALGSRNDQASADSTQAYLQLSFAATQKADSVISLQTADGEELLHHVAQRDFSSLTFSSAELNADVSYTLYVDGVAQQYTGHSLGMGGGMGGGPRPTDGTMPTDAPESFTPPTDRPQRPEGEGGTRGNGGETLEPSTDFILTVENRSFSGITDAAQ